MGRPVLLFGWICAAGNREPGCGLGSEVLAAGVVRRGGEGAGRARYGGDGELWSERRTSGAGSAGGERGTRPSGEVFGEPVDCADPAGESVRGRRYRADAPGGGAGRPSGGAVRADAPRAQRTIRNALRGFAQSGERGQYVARGPTPRRIAVDHGG